MFPDPQNSLNQFEDNYKPNDPPMNPNQQLDEEDDLPLLEDMGIGILSSIF
jgi:hypothetical protein